MMKRYLIVTIMCLATAIGHAQTQHTEIIEQINLASSQMLSMECDFTQTKHLSILDDKMVSEGRMYYQQPDRLRWEYMTPYNYAFILNQNQVMLKNDKRSDVIDVNQNKMFKEIARMMMNSIAGTCLSDQKSFKTEIEVLGDEWVATLYPLKKDMKQMWTRLVLHIRPDLKAVYRVEMHESSGDYTVIDLKNIKMNKPIEAEIFKIDQK